MLVVAGMGGLGAASPSDKTPAPLARRTSEISTDRLILADRGALVSRSGERPRDTPATASPVEVRGEANRLLQARARLERAVSQRVTFLRSNSWMLPLGTLSVTAAFGSGGSLWSRGHTGVDFNGATGDPIRSISSGVVSSSGWDGPYGIKTVVTDAEGTEFWYCHQFDTRVAAGQRVAAGDMIGQVGATGNVTGSHLHLEIRPSGGGPVDPYALLTQRGLIP